MKKEIIEQKIKKLKQQLHEVGMPISGSLHISYRRCGKKGCRCQKSDKDRHGPYCVWYRRDNGKLTTQSIKEGDVHLYKEWIGNRVTLENIIKKIFDLGSQYPSARKNGKFNSLKTTSVKRGT